MKTPRALPTYTSSGWMLFTGVLSITVLVDVVVGAIVRATLPVGHHAAGWLLRPVVIYGHVEHVTPGPPLLGLALLFVIGVVVPLQICPGFRQIPVLLIGWALGLGGAISNRLESGTRGTVTDYLAFHGVPWHGRAVYNLADLQIELSVALTLVGLAMYAVRSRRGRHVPKYSSVTGATN